MGGRSVIRASSVHDKLYKYMYKYASTRLKLVAGTFPVAPIWWPIPAATLRICSQIPMADTAKDPSTIPPPTANDASKSNNNNDYVEEIDTDLAWDDDAFEPAPLARAISEGTEADAKATSGGQEDYEWHATIASPSTNATSTSSAAMQDRESSRQALLSLGTPAAKKKLRCIGCTRPIHRMHAPDQEASGPALCSRCK
jgi:hypothetical protein